MSKETVSSKFCKAAIKLTNVVDNVMWPKFLRSSLNDWNNRPLLSTVKTVGAVCWVGGLVASGYGLVVAGACGASFLTKSGVGKYIKYTEARKEGCSVVDAIDRMQKPISPALMKALQGRNYEGKNLVRGISRGKDNSKSL